MLCDVTFPRRHRDATSRRAPAAVWLHTTCWIISFDFGSNTSTNLEDEGGENDAVYYWV